MIKECKILYSIFFLSGVIGLLFVPTGAKITIKNKEMAKAAVYCHVNNATRQSEYSTNIKVIRESNVQRF